MYKKKQLGSERPMPFVIVLMKYLFDNGLSNHYLSVREAIEYLIEFHDYHDSNIDGIDVGIDDSNTIKKCNIALDNPTKQSVDAYHNNINGLKNSSVLRGAVATMERVPLAQTKYHLTVWYKFLNVILSFRHDKLRHVSNNNTGSGGKRGGVITMIILDILNQK